jgi:DNA polymerase I/DNA polymerase-2
MKFFILDTDYIVEGEKTKIRIWGKDERGRNGVLFFEEKPYFFVLAKNEKEAMLDIQKLLEEKKMSVERIEMSKTKLAGEEKDFIKIICKKPADPQNIRETIKVLEEKRREKGSIIDEYEYSINFYRKFLIDRRINGCCWVEVDGKEIKTNYNVNFALDCQKIEVLEYISMPEFKIVAFDIETVGKKGEKEIVMASFFGKNFKKVLTSQKANYKEWVEVLENEKKILERIVEIFQKENPDIVLTYYGDSFDFQVLNQRCEKNKIKLIISRDKKEKRFSRRARISAARFNGIVHVDLFNFIQNILSPNLQTEVLTLDSVAAEILGDKKIEMDYQELLESWKKGKNLEKLAEYCLKDSELTFKLGEILLPQIFEISRTVGQVLFDVSRMTYGQLVEWYLSRKAGEKGEIIPNQPKFEEIQERRKKTYVGGFVKEPILGIHEKISVLDFRSLYPSLIVSFNISPETLSCECCKDNGHKVPELNYWFCKKREGFIPSVLKEIIKKRTELKKKLKTIPKDSFEYKVLDNRQYALKIISNATYGYFGFSASKWYSKECAESCTALGRYWIKETIKEAEKEGFSVIYADTDSLFLKKSENIEKEVSEFLEKINQKFPGILELELQGFYERGIFIPKGTYGTAKKRYALVDKNGNLLIRGLETVRRDWCNLAKEVQKKVLEFVLKEKNIEKAKEYVRKVINDLRKRKVSLKDLIIYEELTKPIEQYKLISPHVMAAKKLKQGGIEVGEGQVIMFVIQEGIGSISERAEPIEFAKLEKIDLDYYIGHQILPAAMRILQALGVSENELIY